MEVCRKMAGYSYGQADLVRRAMAKKKHDVMLKERSAFVEGAQKNGVPKEIADDIFDEMVSFASYAFNKSHAAAYAYVAYQTAYLKCHYFKQYMAALMTSCLDSTGKLLEYMTECSKNGVKILNPDINESDAGFVPSEQGIRFALAAVKNLGYSSIRDIVAEREENGSFKSLEDFCKRVSGREINRRAAESLIKCGALDGFGLNRRELTENYDRIFSNAQAFSMKNMEGQINFFEMSDDDSSSQSEVEHFPEYSLSEKLEMEKEVIGMYLSGHPLESYSLYSELCRMTPISLLYDESSGIRDGAEISVLCLLQEIKPHTQKNGSRMAFVTLEDMTGEVEGLVFADVFAESRNMLVKGKAVQIFAKLSGRDDVPKLVVNRITEAAAFAEGCHSKKLYIRCRSADNDVIQSVVDICKKYPGGTGVILYFEDIRKRLAPKSITGVRLCRDLAEELYAAAGEENIALK